MPLCWRLVPYALQNLLSDVHLAGLLLLPELPVLRTVLLFCSPWRPVDRELLVPKLPAFCSEVRA